MNTYNVYGFPYKSMAMTEHTLVKRKSLTAFFLAYTSTNSSCKGIHKDKMLDVMYHVNIVTRLLLYFTVLE